MQPVSIVTSKLSVSSLPSISGVVARTLYFVDDDISNFNAQLFIAYIIIRPDFFFTPHNQSSSSLMVKEKHHIFDTLSRPVKQSGTSNTA